MQKQLKHLFPYHILFILLPLFFVQCQGNKKNKIESEIKFKYFADKYGVERFITEDNISGVYITLPNCFIDEYSLISLTDKHNFYCYDSEVYFTIDRIEKDDMDYYSAYFADNATKKQDDLNILRDYAITVRHNSLNNAKKSVYTKITTNKGKLMLMGSVKGYSTQQNKEIMHQFGIIEGGDGYYVLQSFLSVDNTPFFHEDIIEIFKSFSAN